MKKNVTLLCAAVITLAIVSCKKDSPSYTNITGDWNFVGLHVETETSSESTTGTTVSKSVSSSNYNTINNAGSITMDAANCKGNNMTYSVDSRAYSTIYEDGVIIDTFSFPIMTTLPAYTSTASYTRVNNDSIYFPNGVAFFGGVSGASQPGGAKISISGNRFIMTQGGTQTVVDSASGAIVHIKASTVATFQR